MCDAAAAGAPINYANLNREKLTETANNTWKYNEHILRSIYLHLARSHSNLRLCVPTTTVSAHALQAMGEHGLTPLELSWVFYAVFNKDLPDPGIERPKVGNLGAYTGSG